MTTASRTNSKGMYSWWWDSHISPKNSKWLQENLTDMDVKVKQMIKLLEEDADSFARRAEMYYKKRPELMKLVEEFYRAYRALAERYDHATGALRQAHRTMAEAFPNQISLMLSDDSPGAAANEADPRTPEMPPPIRALFEPDELQKEVMGLSPHFNGGKRNGAFTEEPISMSSRKGLKQLNDIFGSGEAVSHPRFGETRARKGLKFRDLEENEQNVKNNEAEISALRQALAKLEAEKEAGRLQYQQSLDKLSSLESEVSRAQEDSIRLSDRATKAEAEAQNLKESLNKLQAQSEASLLQYQRCLEKVSLLENDILNIQKDAEELTARASTAENVTESLKQSLDSVEAEKEDALIQYKECLEKMENLEERLQNAEESSRRYKELAEKAENELITLKQALAKLTEEKEAAALQYQQCMEKISGLEHKIYCAQEEAERLHQEINEGVLKLRDAEEKCLLLERSNLSLQSELESLVLKMGSQTQELTENQEELGRLWSCIQDEHLRFVEAETAFQTLQHLHSQTEEELRSLAAELQTRMQILKNLELQNQGLVAEVQEMKKENQNLSELNISSALSIKNLQEDVSCMREKIRNLELEVELRTNERNALQQEIYCLKEEINELNKRNGGILEQVESVGFNPESFGSSVRELQNEHSRMKEMYDTERSEKTALLEKLSLLEKLVEKNAFLENSISDMNVDLEETREKVKKLEETCQSLLGEKSILSSEKAALTSKLQITTENLEKLSENHVLLENSLADSIVELEQLRVKSRDLEDSCLLLGKEKSGLITEKESLLHQLDISHKTLENLEKIYSVSMEKVLEIGNERDSALREIEKLKACLEAEKQAHSSFTMSSEKRIAKMELQMHILQEECDHWKKLYDEEIDKAVNTQFAIFVLQNSMHDMKENNLSLFFECQRLLEASELSKQVISELERDKIKRELQVKCFAEKNKVLRIGLHQVLKTLDNVVYRGCDVESEQDQMLLNHIFVKVQEREKSLSEICDEYQKLAVEKFIAVKFIEQLKMEGANILMEKNKLDQAIRNQTERISMLQTETEKLWEMNEEMKLKVMEGNQREEALMAELENVCKNLHNLKESHQTLHVENCKSLDEKLSLTKEIEDLRKQKCRLEEENSTIFAETIFESQLSFICKDIISENIEELGKRAECMDELQFTNYGLEESVRIMEEKLGAERIKNIELIEFLEKSQIEAGNHLRERNLLDQELRNQSEKNSMLQANIKELMELEEELSLRVMEGHSKEEVLVSEMKNVCEKLHNLERAHQNLLAENSMLQANIKELMDSEEELSLRVIEGQNKEEVLVSEMKNICEKLHNLERAHQILIDENSVLQANIKELIDSEEELSLRVIEGHSKEEVLVSEMKNVCDKLHNLEGAHQNLLAENSMLQANVKELMDSEEVLSLSVIEGHNKEEVLVSEMKDVCDKLHNLEGAHQNLLAKNSMLQANIKELMESEEELSFRVLEGHNKEEVLVSEMKNVIEKLHNLEGDHQILLDANSMLQANIKELMDSEEELSLRVIEGHNKEEVLVSEMKDVCEKLHNLEEAHQILQAENCEALVERTFFMKEISGLRGEKDELEEVNIEMFTETLALSQLSFILKDTVSENLEELRKLTGRMDKLQLTNNDLEESVKVMAEKVGDEQMKNLELLESLEKSCTEAESYRMERNKLDEELKNQSEQNSTLQGEMSKLLKLNEVMMSKVMEGNYKEEELMIEMENLGKNLHNLEREYQTLHAENSKALEERILLTREISGLRKERDELEEVNLDLFGETIFQSQLSFVYKDVVFENLDKLRNLIKCMDELQFTNSDLEERVKVMEGNFGDEKEKNLELMNSLENLKCEIVEVKTMLSFTECEKSELHKMVEQLSTKCDELDLVNEEHRKLIDKFSSEKDCLTKETEFLHEENNKMNLELEMLHNEAEQGRIREKNLTSELQMKKNEVQSWETQAAAFFIQLQMATVYELFYEGKIHELTEACESLQDSNIAKTMEIELLNDSISTSELENGRIRTQLAAYVPAVQSLKDSISSLEKYSIFGPKTQYIDAIEAKDSDVASSRQSCDDQIHYDGSVELQDLHRRIIAIEAAFEEYERQTTLARFSANTQLEKAMKEIEEVKSRNGWSQESRHARKNSAARFNGLHSKSEISEAGNEVLTKDILLDQVSDSSSYGIRRREADQMLELWESADQDGRHGISVHRTPNLAKSSTKKRSSKHPSNESLVEKELGVDRFEISKRFSDLHQEENKRRILERLDSDAQKLANLQITVQDLKKKMEVTEKSKTAKRAEYDIAKGQVEEAEEAITKLFEMNNKLVKNVEDGFLSADGASTGPEENDSIHSRRISEQARKGSEKIGRLQLELKKLQFLLMKLDDERESKGKSKLSERSPRVLLRDYLYGGKRSRQKHKKGSFCACVRPPTKGD